MDNIRLLLIILFFGAIFAGLVYLIHRLSKGKKFPKYVPGILFMLGAAFFVIRARWFSVGMQDLAFIILAIMLLGVGLVSLVTAILIDLNRKISQL